MAASRCVAKALMVLVVPCTHLAPPVSSYRCTPAQPVSCCKVWDVMYCKLLRWHRTVPVVPCSIRCGYDSLCCPPGCQQASRRCRRELSAKPAAPAQQGLPVDLPLAMEHLLLHSHNAHERNQPAPQYHLRQHPLHFSTGGAQAPPDKEQSFRVFCSTLDGGQFHLRPMDTLTFFVADATIQNATFIGSGEDASLPKVSLVGRSMKARGLRLRNCTLVVAGIGIEVEDCSVDCRNVAHTGIHVDEPQTGDDKRMQRMTLRRCVVENAMQEGVRITCSLQVHMSGSRCAAVLLDTCGASDCFAALSAGQCSRECWCSIDGAHS